MDPFTAVLIIAAEVAIILIGSATWDW